MAASQRMCILVFVAATACGGASQHAVETRPSTMGGVTDGAASADPYGARYPATAADIEFMTHMISHHAQAIVMSRLAPTHGASESIRVLAGRIISAQSDEIHLMQQWLKDHNLPVPEPSPTGVKMVMNGVEHEMLMPGMLTPEQMKQLDAARGPEFDRLFLTLMIQHHEGATAMVAKVFNTPGAGQNETVFKFASDVNVDQTTEITRMKQMLFMLQVARPTP